MRKAPTEASHSDGLIKNRDPNRVEPLVTLICYYLASHKPAHTRLRQQIEERWPYGKLTTRDINRMIDKPIQPKSPEARKSEFMIELIADQGVYLIDALPESEENPRRLATLFLSALIGEDAPDRDIDPVTRKKDALSDLFGVEPSQINETQHIDGDYFGYRRSTTRGAIIRFSLSIHHLGSGVYEFENHFRSRQENWIVIGTGFFKDGNLYLVGNASSQEGKIGRGLRCFALRPEPNRELISGVVLTTESLRRPIGARILLVPTRAHINYRPEATDRGPPVLAKVLADQDAKRFWITDNVDVEALDRGIKIAGDDYPPSETVVRCIRNGTISTVRFDGCEGESIDLSERGKDYLADESFLLKWMENTGGNPTIVYLRAILGAEERLRKGPPY
jgi:hypothetical protein